MGDDPDSLQDSLQRGLWPLIDDLLGSRATAGLAIAVVRGDEVVTRGLGVRDRRTGAPVTPETMFHLASVSKPFVATALVSLIHSSGPEEHGFALDTPIRTWVPEFTLADGRADEVTARGLLSHTSGLPDVSDYGWHAPNVRDDALAEFARSLSHRQLVSDPGSAFSYSNAGYELLGLVLARLTGTTFEDAVRRQLLQPLGMHASTFLRAEVPPHLAAAPHVGMPLVVPEGSYPYTRCHAPSSSLHSNLVELCRWMQAHFSSTPDTGAQPPRLSPSVRDLVWRPVFPVGDPPWEEAMALGWCVGRYRGHRTLSHSGADPGFGARLVLVPEQRTGVVVLANSNTMPTWSIAAAALDIVLPGPGEASNPGDGVAVLRAALPPLVGPVAQAAATSGPDAAIALAHDLAALDPVEFDTDDEEFVKAVWGAIELHRTDLVWPLLRVWTGARPGSAPAWTMTGWAHQVDGQVAQARSALQRALDVDPTHEEAARLLRDLADG
ncbi:MAG: beta-lactamase family protein [Kineosporiaceae bacterium]|nr:beta-lactamase family protein [Kineosporiaceae bacterium]